jgi:hypothetical protein
MPSQWQGSEDLLMGRRSGSYDDQDKSDYESEDGDDMEEEEPRSHAAVGDASESSADDGQVGNGRLDSSDPPRADALRRSPGT